MSANYWNGKRVQIPAFTDNWMRGDRFGVVTSARMMRHGSGENRCMVRVAGDKGTVTRVWADDCEVVS